MLTDVAALVCGYWVAQLSMKDSTPKMSFGWKRAEIVGALCNGSLSLSLYIYIYIYMYVCILASKFPHGSLFYSSLPPLSRSLSLSLSLSLSILPS